MPTNASAPRLAVEALKSALDRHLTACESRSGESDPAVERSYNELREAAEHYDDVLFDTYEEVTPFEFVDSGGTAAADDENPARLSLLVRRDYLVDDLDELLAAARSAALETWPDEAGEPPAEQITTAGRAVYELLQAQGVDGLDEVAEDAGLEPAGGTLWVLAADEDDDSMEGTPFDVDPERLLYRLDEVFEG